MLILFEYSNICVYNQPHSGYFYQLFFHGKVNF